MVETQNVALSIGTIEVVVDAPAPAQQPLPPPAVVSGNRGAADDPVLRQRRQYVTWPEGW
jgi:hypothetical protein